MFLYVLYHIFSICEQIFLLFSEKKKYILEAVLQKI